MIYKVAFCDTKLHDLEVQGALRLWNFSYYRKFFGILFVGEDLILMKIIFFLRTKNSVIELYPVTVVTLAEKIVG